jgi:hypothetical protein
MALRLCTGELKNKITKADETKIVIVIGRAKPKATCQIRLIYTVTVTEGVVVKGQRRSEYHTKA